MGKKEVIRLNEKQLNKAVTNITKQVLKEITSPNDAEEVITNRERIRLIYLKNDIVNYVRKYDMYPCAGQIIDYINFKFNELLNRKTTSMVKESVNKVLNEEQQRWYHWDISTMNDEMETLSHVKSSDALFGKDEDFDGFKTPNAAFNNGLKELKKLSDGSYIMEVWCYVDQANGKPPTTEYVNGYLATNVNGIIRKY